jgi:cytochrome c oxidase subunit IV
MTTNQTRYQLSAGLAFAEEKEMDKLGKLAAEGWLLEGFAFLGFRLRKGQPQQLVYSLDIQDVRENERREYAETFRASGWQFVCSAGNMHIFSAAPGTLPIYSDQSSLREKYKEAIGFFKWASLILWLLFAAGVALRSYVDWEQYSIIYRNILAAVPLLLVLAVPSLMVFVAYLVRLRRLKQ